MTGDCLPLALSGVTKRWRGADEPLLDAVDLIVQPGTCVEVQAANGTGKTTLLRIAAGLIRPERGRVLLGSLDVDGDRAEFQRRIGFLSATSSGLYGRLTVRDHLRLWSRLAMLPPVLAARCRQRVIDAVALGGLGDRRVDRLSMGQRQRVRLAGAFLHDPSVVLLDEPANSLDEDGIAVLAGELERVRGGGRAALWCTPTAGPGVVVPNRRLTIASARLVAA